MQANHPGISSWKELLAFPPRASHVVQIYDHQDFLATAVGHYAAEGLARGEAVVLLGTQDHLAGVRRWLARRAIDVDAATQSGQLSLQDVHAALAAMCPGGALDPDIYDLIVERGLERAACDARFTGLRLWGES